MRSKRAVLVKPRKFEIVYLEVNPGPGEILVKITVCGLCNWELNHWKGFLGNCPQPLGHEWAGEIVELGEGVEGFAIGDFITGLPSGGLNAFAEYKVVNAKECHKVNPELNRTHALGEPLKCITTVLRATAPEFGDYGVVFGCGPMGMWCIQGLAGNLLSGLIAVDIDDKKLEIARKNGADFVLNPKSINVEEKINEITGGHMADFAIEGSGSPNVINNAMRCLKGGRGRLILMSSYETESAPFNLKMAADKSVNVKLAHPSSSMDQSEDMRRAAGILNKGIFKMDNIISHVFSLDDIQIAFETLENKPAGYMKGIVIP
jgi:threonine dehydrogenase-like Zn-dependent dehydrogenase